MYEVAVRYRFGAFDQKDIVVVVVAHWASNRDNAVVCSVGYDFH